MTYDELLEWAKPYGKGEIDLVKYQDWVNALSVQDMTTKDVYEAILDGSMTPTNVDTLKEYWEGLEDEDQKALLRDMLNHWEIPTWYKPAN